MKESSGIIKPAVKRKSHITWTADDDEVFTRMIKDGMSFKEIASDLGNGLNRKKHPQQVVSTFEGRGVDSDSGTISPPSTSRKSLCVKCDSNVLNS